MRGTGVPQDFKNWDHIEMQPMSLLSKEVHRKFLWGIVICYFRFGNPSSTEDDSLRLAKLKAEGIQYFRHVNMLASFHEVVSP